MTQEEKQLLLIDLCARLSYGVKINVPHHYEDEDGIITLDAFWLHDIQNGRKEIKPYLRSMDSMTEEEVFNYSHLDLLDYSNDGFEMPNYRSIDWLNAHHFDYRGLIDKGLALEAPEGMYDGR